MVEVISSLSNADVQVALNDMGLQNRISIIDGTDVPCVVVQLESIRFFAYVQQKQSLCFQAIVDRPLAGFTDIANHWNMNRRFARIFPLEVGYMLRFEADVSHGVTRDNLRALIKKFGASVVEFSQWVQGPSPLGPLP